MDAALDVVNALMYYLCTIYDLDPVAVGDHDEHV